MKLVSVKATIVRVIADLTDALLVCIGTFSWLQSFCSFVVLTPESMNPSREALPSRLHAEQYPADQSTGQCERSCTHWERRNRRPLALHRSHDSVRQFVRLGQIGTSEAGPGARRSTNSKLGVWIVVEVKSP